MSVQESNFPRIFTGAAVFPHRLRRWGQAGTGARQVSVGAHTIACRFLVAGGRDRGSWSRVFDLVCGCYLLHSKKLNRVMVEEIYRVVSQVPAGKVVSYGQVARLAGYPRHARHVGYAMRSAPYELNLPWHRVVNGKGEISLQGRSADLQRALLASEGITFNRQGRLSLPRHRWQPESELEAAGE